MFKRVLNVLLAVMIGAGALIPAMPVSAATLRDYYNENWETSLGADGDNYIGQTFTASSSYILKSIKLRVRRVGSPGTVNVYVTATNTSLPTGSPISSGSFNGNAVTTESTNGEVITVTMSDASIVNGTLYAYYLTAPSGDGSNYLKNFCDEPVSPGYAGGNRILSSNGGVSWAGENASDLMFEIYGDEVTPTVTTSAATSVTSSSATLNGNLTNMGLETSVNVHFGFQKAGGVTYWTLPTAKTSTGAFNATLTELTPNTLYHFWAIAQNGTGEDWTGSILDFTTEEATGTNSVVQVLPASDITNTTATLNGRLVSAGTASPPTRGSFTIYGAAPNTSVTYNIGNGTALTAGDFSVNATGLEPGTQYIYRFSVFDEFYYNPYNALLIATMTPEQLAPHVQTTVGQVFTTTGVSTRTFGVDTVQVVTADINDSARTANLKGILTGLGNYTSAECFFQYGTSTAYSVTTPGQTITSTTYFNEAVTGLLPNQVYHYRACAKNGTDVVYGEDLEFSTYGLSPAPTATGTPVPVGPVTIPASWNTVLGRYVIILVSIILCSVVLVYLFGGLLGKLAAGTVDAIILTAAIVAEWLNPWILAAILILVAWVIYKLTFHPRGSN